MTEVIGDFVSLLGLRDQIEIAMVLGQNGMRWWTGNKFKELYWVEILVELTYHWIFMSFPIFRYYTISESIVIYASAQMGVILSDKILEIELLSENLFTFWGFRYRYRL